MTQTRTVIRDRTKYNNERYMNKDSKMTTWGGGSHDKIVCDMQLSYSRFDIHSKRTDSSGSRL